MDLVREDDPEDILDRLLPDVDQEVQAILVRARRIDMARELAGIARNPVDPVPPAAPEAEPEEVDPDVAEARRVRAEAARRRALAQQRNAAERAQRAHDRVAAAAAHGVHAPVARRIDHMVHGNLGNEMARRMNQDGFLDDLRNELRNRPLFQQRREPLIDPEDMFVGNRARRPPETREQNLARRNLETVRRHIRRAERHQRQRNQERELVNVELGEPNLTPERREVLQRRLRQNDHHQDELRRQLNDFRAQEVAAVATARRLGGVLNAHNDEIRRVPREMPEWNRHLAHAAFNGDDEARLLFIQQNELLVEQAVRGPEAVQQRRRPVNGPTGVIVLGEGSDDEAPPVVDLEQQEAMTAGNGTLKFNVDFKIAIPCNVPMPPFCDHRGAGQPHEPEFGLDYLGWDAYKVRDWAEMFWRREELLQKITTLGIDGKKLHKIADKSLSYATEFPAMNWHTFQVNSAALRNKFFGYGIHNDTEEMGRLRDVDIIRRLMGDNIGEAGIMRLLQQFE